MAALPIRAMTDANDDSSRSADEESPRKALGNMEGPLQICVQHRVTVLPDHAYRKRRCHDGIIDQRPRDRSDTIFSPALRDRPCIGTHGAGQAGGPRARIYPEISPSFPRARHADKVAPSRQIQGNDGPAILRGRRRFTTAILIGELWLIIAATVAAVSFSRSCQQ